MNSPQNSSSSLDELIGWGKAISRRVKKSAGLNYEQMCALPLGDKVRINEAEEWRTAVEELLKRRRNGELPLRYKTIWSVHAEEREAGKEDEPTRWANTYDSIIEYLESLDENQAPIVPNVPPVEERRLVGGMPKTATPQRFDVFLSHNSQDKPLVRELKNRLSAQKLVVWLDEDELRPGIPWQQLLETGIKSSASVAVLVCKDGLGPWEDEEMQAALILAVKDKRAVIPVLLPGASSQPELPMFLCNRTWVDLRAGFTGDGIAKLAWGITGKK